MAQSQEISQAKGRPMLHWVGKKPLSKVEYYPAQEKEVYGNKDAKWFNKLFWGDNLQVLSHLLKEFRGKIDLIYIDPPFDSKADYVKKVKLKGQKIGGIQQSLIEEKQYTDMWDNDEYLQFIFERLQIMRELLSDSGVFYLHCDHRKEHHLRALIEEVFGTENYLNTISWRSQVPRGKKVDAFYFAYSTHYIHIFAKNKKYPPKWHKQVKRTLLTEQEAEKNYMKDEGGFFRTSDPGSYTYESLLKAHKDNRIYVSKGGKLIIDEKKKEIKTTDGTIGIKYYLKQEGDKYVVERAVDNLWEDIPGLGTTPQQDTGYPTQKTTQLLRRIIKTSTDKGDLVMDCFMGSGTTCVVAQQLGRRWIGCDINIGSVQTTTKRINKVLEKQKQEAVFGDEFKGSDAFKIFNVNDYDVFKNEIEAKEIVMDMYGVEPIKRTYFDGLLDNNYVRVMPMNRVLNKLDIKNVLKNVGDKISDFTPKKTSKKGEETFEEGVLVMCSGMELDVIDYLKKENDTGVKIEVRDILTDKQNLVFKQKPEAKIEATQKDGKLSVKIQEFYSPILIRKLEIENEKVLKKKEKSKVEDFKQIIDSIAIDVDYDGKLFNAEIIDVPSKKDVVEGEYTYEYKKKGSYEVAVKIVDVLGEEYFEVIKV